MNKFFTLLALTATCAFAQRDKCSKLECAAPLSSVPEAGQTKWCNCECALSCGEGQEASTAECACVDADPCAGQTCDDKADPSRWMMDATCACGPAEGEDACDAAFAGTAAAEAADCPAGTEGDMAEGEAGAIAQTAGLALAFAAALLF